jgi:hypothetical protein
MSIRSQTLTRNVLTIVGSDGRTYAVPKEQVQAFYANETSGNAASRRNQVITWYRNGLAAALGAENVKPAELTVGFDVVDGGWTDASWAFA